MSTGVWCSSFNCTPESCNSQIYHQCHQSLDGKWIGQAGRTDIGNTVTQGIMTTFKSIISVVNSILSGELKPGRSPISMTSILACKISATSSPSATRLPRAITKGAICQPCSYRPPATRNKMRAISSMARARPSPKMMTTSQCS